MWTATAQADRSIEALPSDIHVQLTARLLPDLRTIEGQLQVRSKHTVELTDVLSLLPDPPDDLWLRRTFPGRPQRGELHMMPPSANGNIAFTTVLPARGDASGRIPGAGVFANGLWYPQPTVAGSVPVVDWQVDLALPAGVVGVLNNSVEDATTGASTLSWTGQAERLSLAVLRRGRVQQLDLPTGSITLVDRGPVRPRRDNILQQLSQQLPHHDALVIVETPAWRRLARPGPGLLFLSDRAFAVTGPLWHFHVAAVRRALLQSALPLADPWLRAFVADSLAERAEDIASPRELLGWLSWIPEIDSLLYDGSLPFYGEVFDEPWPSDPVADDLQEILDPHAPGRVLAHRLDLLRGPGTTAGVADALLTGASLSEALSQADVSVEVFDQLSAVIDGESLRVDLERQALTHARPQVLTITRDAPPDAAAEPVRIDIDGQARLWEAGPGPDHLELRLEQRPHSVIVDPAGDVKQSPAFDRWPRRWTATVSFFPAELSLSDTRITAYGDLILRRQYDTRWLFDLGLATDPEDLVRAELTVLHYRGPLQDRRARPLRLWFSAGPALLDPSFRSTDSAALAVGGAVGVAWETRVDRDLPMRGYRLAASTDGGLLPGASAGLSDAWGALHWSATGLLPLSGRLVLAGRLTGGLATGGVQHRLLTLGGSSGVRGVPRAAVVGERSAIANTELRWQALRNAHIPLWIAWLSQLQLSGGLDAGTLHTPSGLGSSISTSTSTSTTSTRSEAAAGSLTHTALGWTAGLGGTADILGARPTFAGLTIGGLLHSDPFDLQPSGGVEVYLRLDESF